MLILKWHNHIEKITLHNLPSIHVYRMGGEGEHTGLKLLAHPQYGGCSRMHGSCTAVSWFLQPIHTQLLPTRIGNDPESMLNRLQDQPVWLIMRSPTKCPPTLWPVLPYAWWLVWSIMKSLQLVKEVQPPTVNPELTPALIPQTLPYIFDED